MKHNLLATSLLCLALGSASVHATSLYWAGNGTALGGTGTWDTTNGRFGTSSSGPFTTVWNNANTDDATLSGQGTTTGNYVVTLGANITMNGTLTWQNTPGTYASYSINGANTLTFAPGSQLNCNNSAGGSMQVGSFNARYAGTITKTGTAQLEFNNANGAVTKYIFKQGTASFASFNRLGGSDVSDFLTFDGGKMRFNSTTAWTMGRSITVNSGNGTIFSSSTTITLTQDKPITFNGGNLTIDSSVGPLILTATTSTGSGTLTINTATSLNGAGCISSSAVLAFGSSVTATLGANQTIKALSGSAGTVAVGTRTLTINDGGSLSSPALFTGTGKIIKQGAGTQTLSGSSTGFTGEFDLNNGTIGVGHVNCFGGTAGSGLLVINGGTISSSSSTARAMVIPLNIAGNMTCDQTVSSGAFTFNSGAITIKAANPTITVSPAAQTLTFGALIGQDVSGRGFTKAGAGTLILAGSAANTYSGQTTVSAGTLTLGMSTGTAGVAPFAGDLLINGSGTVNYSSGSKYDNQIPDTANVTLASGGTLAFGPRAETIGQTSPSAAGSFTMTGGSMTVGSAGPVQLNRLPSITGGTVTLTASDSTLNFGDNLTLANATLDMTDNGASGSARVRLQGGEGTGITYPVTGTATAYIKASGGDPGSRFGVGPSSASSYTTVFDIADAPGVDPELQIDARMSSGSGYTGAINKTGAGKMTLTAAATFSGNITVSQGTLALSGGGAIPSVPNLTVNGGAIFDVAGVTTPPYSLASGQTLGGNGTIHGKLTVASGATLAPGASIGTLTFDDNLTLAGTTSMEINKTAGTADKIVMSSGTVTLGGNLNVVNLAGTLALNDTFDLVDGTIAGNFANVSSPGGGLAWDASQLQAGGNGTIKAVCDGTLTANAGANQSVCYLGSAVIGGSPTATGGSGTGYTYSWSPTTGLNDATLANPTASPTTTTTYTVTVTDSLGCTAMSSMTVTTGAATAISTQPANQTVCSGSTATFSVAASGPGTVGYSWSKNDNSGWGSAWSVSGSGGTFRATSTDNNFGDPACNSFSSAFDINSPSGNAMGMWGGASGDTVATRAFAALAAGQAASIDFDNGNVDNGREVGFSLEATGGADVVQFYFLGGQANYKYWDTAVGEQDTGIPFQRTGVRAEFALTSATTYELIVTPCGGTATKFTGSYSGTIAQLKLFNQNTTGGNDYNIYFNNFLVGGYTDNADNYSGDYAGLDKGNQPIALGNGGSTYTTPALTTADNGAQYQVVVYGCGGSVVSSAATVTVNPLPTVSVTSETICAGGSATLTATTGASSPSYLWSPGGATTASITVSPTTTTTYTVTVTDGATSCANSGSGTVTVNPLPTVSVNSEAICAGGSATLTATTSASSPSYLWSPDGQTTASITVSPSSTTTYTVTVTDGTTSCANSGSGTVTVNPLPTVSVNSATICAGGSAMLTATTSASSPSYLWSPGGATTPSITVSPSSTTTYTVTVTDGVTSCANSGSGTVTVNPLPAVSVNSETICAGGSATLTATTGASSPSYLWSPGGATTPSITISPSSTTAYTVTVTDGVTGCANSSSGTVTVTPLPTVSVNSESICAGGSATLTATTGASSPSYLWSPGGATTASITVSPSSTTTYTVTVTDGVTSCANGGSGTVTVVPQPTLTTDTTNQVVCMGSQVTWSVVATGTSLTYRWQRDGTNLLEGVDNFTGTAAATLTNSAVGSQDSVDAAHGYACIISSSPCSDITSTLVSLTVNPLPTASVNSETVCAGGSATLTATTSASSPSYLWSPGGATTAAITVSPSSTTTYTVVVTDGTTGCANSGSGTVTVNPLPTASVNSETICAGGSATLTATTGASNPSYLWSPGGATTASITVSPSATTTYTVTVTDGVTSCANSGSGTVTVNPLPAVSVNSAAICAGAATTLTATSDASNPSYLWSPGGATTASITVSPSSTTTYTVTVTDGMTGCANSGSGTVTVNPLPTVSVNSATICAGASETLTATTSGSSPSYLWSPGGATTASITVSPSSTTTYTVTVTDGVTGCANSGSGTVTVNPLPTVSVNSATICAGASETLTATTGASSPSYLWSPGGATTASITVSPTSTTTYTVTVTDGVTSCANSGSGTVTVNPLPTVSVNSMAVCPGGSATLTATTGASSPSYLWSPGGATTVSITVSPSSTTTYTVTVTDGVTTCANSGSGTVTVNPLPTVSVNSAAICAGGSATLTATTGASSPSYLWSPGGATTASITVSPSSTTTYTVTVTDGTTTCANSGSGTVTVNAAPTAAAGSDQMVCSDSPVSIGGDPTASGGTAPYTYSWAPTTGLSDATVANPTATITSTTTYTVTVTDANGCTGSAAVVLTIIPNPVIESITLSGTDATLVWSSLAGQTYRLQYKTDLNDPEWTDLRGDVVATDTTATKTDSVGAATQRFYRVQVVCP